MVSQLLKNTDRYTQVARMRTQSLQNMLRKSDDTQQRRIEELGDIHRNAVVRSGGPFRSLYFL